MKSKKTSGIEVQPKINKEVLLSDLYMDVKNSDMSKDMTEEQIRNYTLDAYTKVSRSFESSFDKKKHFSINNYLDGAVGRTLRSMTLTKKYSSDTINKMLESPQYYKEELVRLGLYLYIRVQEYKGIVEYKSGMLTYSNVLRPHGLVDEEFDVDSYKKNLQFISDYNIASKFGKATKYLVREDVYFAYELSDGSGKNFIWKQLPSDYCVILGRDRFETYKVGFNFGYFDTYPNDLMTYPLEFQEKYAVHKAKRTASKVSNLNTLQGVEYIELDVNKAVAFKFDESVDFVLPYYSGLYIDMTRLLELKDLDMVNAISDNYKLVHQLIPLFTDTKAEDDYALSGDDIEGYHSNVRANVPEGIGVATTPMKLEGITLKTNVGSQEENIVSKHISNLMSGSGTSKILFNGNSTSAVGLEKNIQVDENMLFKLLRQYELYMNKRLFLYNKQSYKYRLQFLDHTYFNTEILFERYLKMGQFGFNTEFETSAVCGINQIDFINNCEVVDLLGIKDKMKPFQSSHTADGSGEQGSPKATGKLTDEGARSRDRGL